MIKSWRIRWVGHVECTESEINEYKCLALKPEEPITKPRGRQGVNIKMESYGGYAGLKIGARGGIMLTR
jgi:hypothetical protein